MPRDLAYQEIRVHPTNYPRIVVLDRSKRGHSRNHLAAEARQIFGINAPRLYPVYSSLTPHRRMDNPSGFSIAFYLEFLWQNVEPDLKKSHSLYAVDCFTDKVLGSCVIGRTWASVCWKMRTD